MLKTRNILIIFIPAILIVVFALFIRVVQFESLHPDSPDENSENSEILTIPIFPDDPIVGEKKAPITLIAFEDFGCEKCRQQNMMLTELMEKHPGKVKIIWKSLSVTRIPYSTEIVNGYAYCANEQKKFEEFKQLAFTNSGNLSLEIVLSIGEALGLNDKKLNSCLESGKSAVNAENNKQVALMLNIQAVPRFFVDNKQIQTPGSLGEWERVLRISD